MSPVNTLFLHFACMHPGADCDPKEINYKRKLILGHLGDVQNASVPLLHLDHGVICEGRTG